MISLFINALQKGKRLTRTLSESLWSFYYLLRRVLPLKDGGVMLPPITCSKDTTHVGGKGYGGLSKWT